MTEIKKKLKFAEQTMLTSLKVNTKNHNKVKQAMLTSTKVLNKRLRLY